MALARGLVARPGDLERAHTAHVRRGEVRVCGAGLRGTAPCRTHRPRPAERSSSRRESSQPSPPFSTGEGEPQRGERLAQGRAAGGASLGAEPGAVIDTAPRDRFPPERSGTALCFQTAFAFPLVSWMLGRGRGGSSPVGGPGQEVGGAGGAGQEPGRPSRVGWASAPRRWRGAESPLPRPLSACTTWAGGGAEAPARRPGKVLGPWSGDGTWLSARPRPAAETVTCRRHPVACPGPWPRCSAPCRPQMHFAGAPGASASRSLSPRARSWAG